MNKKEFIDRWDAIKNPLCDKYGGFLFFLASDVFNISHMEKVCQSYGYKTERKKYPSGGYSFYSEITFNGKVIGVIDNQGFPSVELYKRQMKHAKIISEHESVIEAIEGVHRVLSWHETTGRFHKLAGGEVVLHFLPVDITDEKMVKFLTDAKLIDRVEEFKNPPPQAEPPNEKFSGLLKIV